MKPSWATGGAVGGATTALARTAAVIRRVIGAPDYERYLSHLLACHPNERPLSRTEFERQRMEDRYNKPGSRCC